MQATMKAARIYGFEKTSKSRDLLKVDDVPIPDIESGEVLIRVLRAGLNVKLRDDHPDFPALVLANYLLGGTSTARMPGRVREKEGLSYSTFTSFSSDSSVNRS